MRDVVLFAHVTVDGFTAGPNHDLSFIVADEELNSTMTSELMARADTIVMGRKSFEGIAA